ncbi:MAG: T9SS type A sorting domain-containing protein, partial [Ignavibacteriae bacterium]|nr:T9SS type A sorting domain-containing protein [Ignavibacteriota bacterium]
KNNNGGFLEVKKLINNNWSDIGNTSIVISELSKYAIDNSGTIYMLYKSIVNNKAYLKKYENGIWSDFSINPISSGSVNSLDIEIDNNNQICVVFTDSDLSGNRFLYKRYNGNDFTTLATSNYFNVNVPITNLNLKFDSNNTPFFAMNYGNLIIQKFDNNSWTTLGYLSSYDGEFDIVIDKDIVPNILYVADKSSSTIRVKKYENSSFVNVGSIINPISVDSEDLSLTTINNQVYIAYRNTNQGGGINYRVYVKKFNGTDWEEIGDLSNNSVNFDNPLLRSNNNTLYLFYNNKSNGFANLISYENNTWSNIGSNNFSSAKSNNSDLLFFNSTPIVLYTSDTGVFGKYYGIENVLSTEDFDNVLNLNTYIYPNPVLDKFKIKTDDIVIDMRFYDITGKEIQKFNNINNEIDISNFNKGQYLLKIQLLNSTKTLKLIKK